MIAEFFDAPLNSAPTRVPLCPGRELRLCSRPNPRSTHSAGQVITLLFRVKSSLRTYLPQLLARLLGSSQPGRRMSQQSRERTGSVSLLPHACPLQAEPPSPSLARRTPVAGGKGRSSGWRLGSWGGGDGDAGSAAAGWVAKQRRARRDWKHGGSVRAGTEQRAARKVGEWEVEEARGRAWGTAQAGQGGAQGRGNHQGGRVPRRLCPLEADGAL